jgi:hypothetical protein
MLHIKIIVKRKWFVISERILGSQIRREEEQKVKET